MTVRLSDESAAFIDGLVARGTAPSRASALDRLVRREQRRLRAQQDALIYVREGENPDLDGWVAASAAALRERDLDA